MLSETGTMPERPTGSTVAAISRQILRPYARGRGAQVIEMGPCLHEEIAPIVQVPIGRTVRRCFGHVDPDGDLAFESFCLEPRGAAGDA